MRALGARLSLQLALLVGLALACETAPEPSEASDTGSQVGQFSADRAWRHLVALSEIGPRLPGSEGAERARRYLREQLDAMGVEVEERPFHAEAADGAQRRLVNLVARVPGESPRRIVLAAAYDAPELEGGASLGANRGASGAAVLLEVMRQIALRPLPYTTLGLFLDGEAGLGSPSGPAERFLGSRAEASRLAERAELDEILLLVVLDRVGDAQLRVARDSRSSRQYRDRFWSVAAQLDRTDAFPPGAPFESPEASHLAFLGVGMRRAVALVDTQYGADESGDAPAEPGIDSVDRCSPRSLETVGLVTLAGLEAIAQRFAKIDRFTRDPVAQSQSLEQSQEARPTEADSEASAVGNDDAADRQDPAQLAPPAVGDSEPAPTS